MKRWWRYMAVSAAVVVVVGALIVLVVGHDVLAPVTVAAGIGLVVQALAAVLLFGSRGAGHPSRFMVGWAGGALLRMMAVLATGLWLTRTGAVAIAPALLSLVTFLFVLTLIEPLFLKTAE
ncbi:MAG TPA: hypothetical protein VF039_04185 [Longimicrobiales bacterium]